MRWLVLCLWVTAKGLPASTYAQAKVSEANRVQFLARKAFTARSEGRNEDAVALYLQAFQIEPVPGLLYNIAYIYDRDIGDLELASRFYRRCIAAEGVEATVVRRANGRLATLRERMRENANQRRTDAITTNRSGTTRGRNTATNAVRTKVESPSARGPWWLMGIGATLLVTGLATGGIAAYNSKQFGAATLLSEKKDIRDLAQTQALTADILMGTGALTALAGLTWYFISDREQTMAPLVQLNRSYFGLSWSSTF